MEPIKKVLHDLNLSIESAELEWVPKSSISLPENKSEKAYDFLDALQDHDDVKNVYTNLN